ncbi:hypothetical protein [Agrobacterium tumefaciens]|uniref:hypothetical protein n=1 Tax=Agrobacterium tumefaciens TaxID=358 RepID=UPI001F47131D|nr:hypothetical protein [Agrobacterium tumefaciens]WCK74398.1 hypothetical protein G6L96_026485 [Agrobacterium tumefaciens]
MAKHILSSHHVQRKISDFCEVRVAPIASKRMLQSIKTFLVGLVIHRHPPPIVNGRMDWTAIGQSSGIENHLTTELKKALRPGLDAINRNEGDVKLRFGVKNLVRLEIKLTPSQRAPSISCS